MAVGIVSSAAKQQLPAAAPVIEPTSTALVLRSGEKQASTQAALADPNAATYYHRIPGARFIMPDGLELQFLGGRFVTHDPAIVAELNKIANRSTSMIFTEQAGIEAVTAAEKALADEAGKSAGTSA
jgi:hypothetical protein